MTGPPTITAGEPASMTARDVHQVWADAPTGAAASIAAVAVSASNYFFTIHAPEFGLVTVCHRLA
jgi:hypothetical protein